MPLIIAHLKARLSHDDMILAPLEGAIYSDRLKGLTEFTLAAAEKGLVLVPSPLAGSLHAPINFSDYCVTLPLDCTQEDLDKVRKLVKEAENEAVDMVYEIDRDHEKKKLALAAFKNFE